MTKSNNLSSNYCEPSQQVNHPSSPLQQANNRPNNIFSKIVSFAHTIRSRARQLSCKDADFRISDYAISESFEPVQMNTQNASKELMSQENNSNQTPQKISSEEEKQEISSLEEAPSHEIRSEEEISATTELDTLEKHTEQLCHMFKIRKQFAANNISLVKNMISAFKEKYTPLIQESDQSQQAPDDDLNAKLKTIINTVDQISKMIEAENATLKTDSSTINKSKIEDKEDKIKKKHHDALEYLEVKVQSLKESSTSLCQDLIESITIELKSIQTQIESIQGDSILTAHETAYFIQRTQGLLKEIELIKGAGE